MKSVGAELEKIFNTETGEKLLIHWRGTDGSTEASKTYQIEMIDHGDSQAQCSKGKLWVSNEDIKATGFFNQYGQVIDYSLARILAHELSHLAAVVVEGVEGTEDPIQGKVTKEQYLDFLAKLDADVQGSAVRFADKVMAELAGSPSNSHIRTGYYNSPKGVDEIEQLKVSTYLTSADRIENTKIGLLGSINDDIIRGNNDASDLLIGHHGNDKIYGGSGRDFLFGGEGDDILLHGEDGNDLVVGGDGSDTIKGGDGDDVLYGGDGDDILKGETGSDILKGGKGHDTYFVTDGDVVEDIDGDGQLWLGTEYPNHYLDFREALFMDPVLGSPNTLAGYLHAFHYISVIMRLVEDDLQVTYYETFGNENIKYNFTIMNWQNGSFGLELSFSANPGLGPDPDPQKGTPSSDEMNGTDGDDHLIGKAGDDILIGGDGADTLDGGKGWDTAAYWGAKKAVTVNLASSVNNRAFSVNSVNSANNVNNRGEASGDVFISIEAVIGSDYDDKLIGDDGWNGLYGSYGDDVINGQGGNDNIEGGKGDDVFVIGQGSDHDVIEDFSAGAGSEDVVRFEAGFSSFSQMMAATRQNGDDIVIDIDAKNSLTLSDVELADLHEDDFEFPRISIVGMDNDETLSGTSVKDHIRALDGNDMLIGGAGADILDGGDGWDTAVYWDAASGVRVNLSDDSKNTGIAAGDSFVNIEAVIGSSYDDTITGDDGWNGLYGGEGDDVLNGKDGNDNIEGGEGDDVFIFAAGDDDDVIEDFSAGSGSDDVIELSGISGFDSFADVLAVASDQGADTFIRLDDDDSILLKDVSVSDLHQDDFRFA
ncbi:MAG: hypothetical protein OIF58_14900 [Cohaesibacter sp.]|nr:hypothetical protein [Cohaesibacter sp.]